MERGGFVYILASKTHSTLYVGVTADLISRVIDHRNKSFPKSFTARYNVSVLVYYEGFNHIEEAIQREKQIKAGSRQNKIDLIESINPQWVDLFEEIKKW